MSTQKHILFFSNFCHYSKDLMNLIVKKNIKHLFVFINVDDAAQRGLTLPPVVDRVPMIITSNKQVLADDRIMVFLQDMAAPREEQISPFTITGRGNGSAYSDGFSYIHGDEQECTDDFCRGFGRLNDHESTRVDAANTAEMFTSRDKKQDMTSQAYERLMSERDNDMKMLRGVGGPGAY